MSRYLVFVRFFLGYSAPFPFDRFLRLEDEEIDAAIMSLRDEWWANSGNRKRFVERERAALARPVPTVTARPGRHLHLRQPYAPRTPPQRTARNGVPGFEEVARCAGWWDGMTFGGSACGISRRYAIARFEKKSEADTAAAVLQERAVEVARVALRGLKKGTDMIVSTANPRFVPLPESMLSNPQRLFADDQISRVGQPLSDRCSVEESLLHLHSPHLLPTLEQVKSQFNPVPTLDATQVAVLRFLAETAPRLALNAEIEAGAERAKQAVIAAVNWLIDRGLATRPNGPRKGTAITDEGKRLLARIG
jgi:hypothetical protein